jgi:hypothetical protein
MRRDALEELKAENPLPDELPALPIETIRQRLDHELAPTRISSRRSRPTHRLVAAFALTAVVATGVVLVIVSSVPDAGSAGFSVADATAAIRTGEGALSASTHPVLYTQEDFTVSRPGQRTTHSVQREWQSGRAWRLAGSGGWVTDLAFIGGVTAFYVPRQDTLYVNRPRANIGPGSLAGLLPATPDPGEFAIAALLHIEGPGATATWSGFKNLARQLMALPGARVTRTHGLLSISARRGNRSATIAVRSRSYTPVLIKETLRGPGTVHGDYDSTIRFSAYYKRLPAAAAAKAFNLLRVYLHARVVILHRQDLRLP